MGMVAPLSTVYCEVYFGMVHFKGVGAFILFFYLLEFHLLHHTVCEKFAFLMKIIMNMIFIINLQNELKRQI